MSETSIKPSLDRALCLAIEGWQASHPDLTILETLTSLENIRHLLTEIWLEKAGLK